ncbi:hypothetical protein BgiBS90_009330 [Biomphalaria glabrata]|nr:hypothetical protein BgiBS90_009330 [Biomphalaria glabrata]
MPAIPLWGLVVNNGAAGVSHGRGTGNVCTERSNSPCLWRGDIRNYECMPLKVNQEDLESELVQCQLISYEEQNVDLTGKF